MSSNGAMPTCSTLSGRAHAHQFRDSRFDQAAEIWGPGGDFFAVTRQIVYFKEWLTAPTAMRQDHAVSTGSSR